ncbi:hypothetical protein EJ02DRAFT_368695 [Clathrospora elynae]|uniref:Uncharacterized protein n=1 Tax=Clathrospora elynae TaxID=706981 RepID=A0A6A5T0R9_9PLEO|nr:hypothetical protein EJ02DRAFT_368695 [Clathrospora elynae]
MLKKEKKKAKKAKRGSVADTEPSTPSTPIDEHVKELAEVAENNSTLDQQPVPSSIVAEDVKTEASTPHLEEQSTSVPSIEHPTTNDFHENVQEETATQKSKKDKKKAKKSTQRVETAETGLTETPAPAEQLFEEARSVPYVGAQSSTSLGQNEQVAVTPSDAQQITSNTTVEPIELKPTEQPIISSLGLDVSPVTIPEAPVQIDTPSTAISLVDSKKDEEEEPAEWAGLSKSQKKKLKKAKHVSVADGEPSQPAIHAVDDLSKEVTLDEQSITPQVVHETNAESKPVEEQVSTDTAIEEPASDKKPVEEQLSTATAAEGPGSDPKPAEAEEDPPPTSKKDKKKAKKAGKKAVPFLADETPEAANSDTQPSLSNSILSETTIPFSGIPTYYPHTFVNELIDSPATGESVQEEGSKEVGEVEEKKEVDVEEKKEVDVEEKKEVDVEEKKEVDVEEKKEVDVEEVVKAEGVQEPVVEVVSADVPPESSRELGDVKVEKALEVEQPATSSELQEPMAEEVETATTKKGKKSKKGKKRESVVEASVLDTPSAVTEAEVPALEPSTPAEVEPVPEVEAPILPDISLEHPHHPAEVKQVVPTDASTVAEKETLADTPALTSTTQSEQAVGKAEEDISTSSKKKRKGKKDKHALPIEEVAQETIVPELGRSIHGNNNVNKEVAAPELEQPVTSPTEDAKPIEALNPPGDTTAAGPFVGAEVTNARDVQDDEKHSEDVAAGDFIGLTVPPVKTEDPFHNPQDIALEDQPTVITKDSTPANVDHTVDTAEQSFATPTEALQPEEATIDESSTPKKSKKKDKKSKRQSGTATPIEIVPEVQLVQPEEPAPTQIVDFQPASTLTTERSALFEVKEAVAEQSKGVQPASETPTETVPESQPPLLEDTASTPIDEVLPPSTPIIERDAPLEIQANVPEQLGGTHPLLETYSEPQPPVEDVTPGLSKKDKKKSKKAQKQSGTATPVGDNVFEAQPDNIEVTLPAPIFPAPSEATIEPGHVEEIAALSPQEDLQPVSADEVVQLPQPEVQPTTVYEIRVQEAQPVSEPAIESSQPAEGDWGFTPPSKRGKKKGKELDTATPITEVVPQESVSEADLIVSHAEIQSYPSPSLATTLDIAAVDITKAEPLPTPSAEPDAMVERVDAAPLSKNKKKAKKGKAKASDTATPMTEGVPEPIVDVSQNAVAAEPIENQIVLESIPASELQEQSVVDLPSVDNDADSTSLPIVEQESAAVDDEASSLGSKNKNRKSKKEKKFGTTTPLTEEVTLITTDVAQEPLVAETAKKVAIDDAPLSQKISAEESIKEVTKDAVSVIPAQEDPVVQEDNKIEHEPATTTPVVYGEPSLDDLASASVSTKKSKTKGKKSGTATPIVNDMSTVKPEVFADLSKKVESSKPDAVAVFRPIVEDQLKAEETPFVAEAPVVAKETLQVPVAVLEPQPESSEQVPELVQSEQTASLEEVKDVAIIGKPALDRKLSKNENKKAQKQAAATFLDTELIAEREPIIAQATTESLPTVDAVDSIPTGHAQQSDLLHLPSTQEPPAGVEISRELPEQITSVVEDIAITPKDEQPQEDVLEDERTSTPKKDKKTKKDKNINTQRSTFDVASDSGVKPSKVPKQIQVQIEPQAEPVITGSSQPLDVENQSGILDTDQSPFAINIHPTERPTEPAQAHDQFLPPSLDFQPLVEQPRDKDITSQATEATELPESDLATEIEVTREVQDDVVLTSLSRQASRKSKKSKKAQDAPSALEAVEQLATPTNTDLADQALSLEPISVVSPVVEGITEPVTQPTAFEQVPMPSTSEPIIETNSEPAAILEVAKDNAEDAWGFTPPKKSKKDKKKSKKSMSTSGDATPADGHMEPVSMLEAISAPRDISEHHGAHPDTREASTLQESVGSLPSSEEIPLETPNPATTEMITQKAFPAPDPTQENEPKTTKADESEFALFGSMSKKSKKKKAKKGQKIIDEMDSESSTPATPIIELPSAVLQDEPLNQTEVLPNVTEAKVEAERPASPSQGSTREVKVVETEPLSVLADIPPQHISRGIAGQPIEPSAVPQEADKVVGEATLPVIELSPSLKAIQDEAVDLRLRAAALDDELAASEKLDEPAIIQPASMFDVVTKLAKKDKKKVKNGKDSTFDSELVTPAAEPEAAVETRVIVETPTLVEQSATEAKKAAEPPIVEEEPIYIDAPSRKLSKKEKKKKGKQPAFSLDEPSDTAFEPSTQINEVPEPTIDQPTEDQPANFKLSISEQIPEPESTAITTDIEHTILREPIVQSTTPLVFADTLTEGRPKPSRKLSKKDKKKAKQYPVENEPTVLSEIAFPTTSIETREVSLPDHGAALPDSAPVVEELLDTRLQEPQETSHGERFSLSRKHSKDVKKKQTETFPSAQGEPIQKLGETIKEEDAPSATKQQDVSCEEPPTLSRKFSKDKKKAESISLRDEPAKLMTESKTSPDVQESMDTEVAYATSEVQEEPSIYHSLPTLASEPSIGLVPSSERSKETGIVRALELAGEPSSTQDGFARDPSDADIPGTITTVEEAARSESTASVRLDAEPEITVTELQPVVAPTEPLVTAQTVDHIKDVLSIPVVHQEELAVAPALTRNQSKKDKNKTKNKGMVTDESEAERSNDVMIAEDGPIMQRPAEVSQLTEKAFTTTSDMITEGTPYLPLPTVADKDQGNVFLDIEPRPSEMLSKITDETGLAEAVVGESGPELEPSSKKGKKQKRKKTTTATSWDEPIDNAPVSVSVEDVPEPSAMPAPMLVDHPKADAILGRPLPSQFDEAYREESTSMSRDIVEEPMDLTTSQGVTEDVPLAGPEPEPKVEPIPKESKEKRNSKKTKPVAQTDNVLEVVQDQSSLIFPNVQARDDALPSAGKSVDTPSAFVAPMPTEALAAPQPPTLHTKSSKKHKLAALFERGAREDASTGERSLRKDGTGSVKDLAKQYENQSRSGTPILIPTVETRGVSRVTSRNRLGSKSPERDIDFAATVAASLQESGFDPGYVINDQSFHRPTSAQGVRDIAPDDDVAAAKERATTSRLGSLSRSSSFSRSPKTRPTKLVEPDVLPPIEVAMAPTDTISFDPLDVLNDPTFSTRKSPTGVLEEADPDELAASSMLRRASGKKKRKSLPEAPLETSSTRPTSDKRTTTMPADAHPMAVGESSAPPLEQVEGPKSVTTTNQGKKSKKDKKRAPIPQNSVEYAAAETPAIEALADVPLAVETPVDSTVREVELNRSRHVVETDYPALDEQSKKKSRKPKKEKTKMVDTDDKALVVEDTPSLHPAFDQEPRSLDADEPDEYPFPVVVTKQETSQPSIENSHRQELESERDLDVWAPALQKEGKKSRRGKEKAENSIDHIEQGEGPADKADRERVLLPLDQHRGVVEHTADHAARPAIQEPHKRRRHPVSFAEDQPDEKRLHTSELSQEPQYTTYETASPPHMAVAERLLFDTPPLKRMASKSEASSTNRGLAPATESSWSFAGLRDSVVHTTDSPVPTHASQFEESTLDSGYHDAGYSPVVQQGLSEPAETTSRQTKRRSREPTTPLDTPVRAVASHRDVEESPALPVAAISTPGTDFATKERTSYLFDSSPSTRTYGTSPVVPPQTPIHDSHRAAQALPKDNTEALKKAHTEPHHGRVSPTKEINQKEPHQSLFGDPSEKKTKKNSTPPTQTSKHARTPSNKQLESITEASPDDTPSHKKARSIADIGVSDRGQKSLRRTENPKPFSERLKSPPPVTPTPSSRIGVPVTLETSGGRATTSQDSPLHQVHESVDRAMTLSPARRLPRSSPSADPLKQYIAEQRSPSAMSQRSMSNIARLRTPDQERSLSSMSNRSTQSLRRVDRSASGDLRNVSRLGEASAQDAKSAQLNLSSIALVAGTTAPIAGIAAASKYAPVRGEGKGRRASMAETFEAWGEAPGSPMSPARPPSVRKRQSMQIMDLQTQLDQLAAQNESLEYARARAEETMQAAQHQRQVDEQLVHEEVEARDREIHQRDIDIAQLKDTLQRLQEEIARLKELNNTLTDANRNLTNDANERYAQLQSEGQLVHQQWQSSQRELEGLRAQHNQMTRVMEEAVRDEVGMALDERNAEIDRLNGELASAREQVKSLQKQILASKKPSESFLTTRDEDYFDSACQQLCQHVQQWVLRFSKFSDTRACRLSSEISADTRLDASTRQKIDTRLDNAILDGSDVDALLADRVKRRDVFMSVVMTMIWEYVFTRYLFGMDREQRQKLKSLEKTLSEVGPPRAVAQWRAITLTLLAKREPFVQQRAQDTEAVVHEIYSTLSTLLPPPSHLQRQIQESLRNVMRLAVELSIEMRTQRAEFIMLPPLQPEYDTNGDLIAKVTFNASLMNERSGETTSNDELEARGAVVKIVLFPLVVKKGDDFGEGEDEIVVCPAQVLVAGAKNKKVVRVMSGAMSMIDRPNSRASRMTTISRLTSLAADGSAMDLSGGGGNVI